MRMWKKAAVRVGALAAAAVMAMSVPLTARAWDLNGESTQVNDIETKNPSSLITTIQTNFHADGITGFVVLTPSTTIDSILGITKEMQTMEGRGIIYIANTSCGEKADEAFKNEAAKVNGEILRYLDIQLFKFDGTWNEPQTTISSPIRMAVGIGSSARSTKHDYAVVRLHDGATTLLKDLDDDEYTVTFESDQFSTYALIRYPKGTEPAASHPSQQKPGAEQTAQQKPEPAGQPSQTADGGAAGAAGELDEVPKTGDTGYSTAAGLVLFGVMLLTAGAVLYSGRSMLRRAKAGMSFTDKNTVDGVWRKSL